ncbi:MAG: DUF5668 domain-containing protein [Anaerolineae bacterium]|nr:DUF5668 domain-containing protein [Anaerolineae bacterium]
MNETPNPFDESRNSNPPNNERPNVIIPGRGHKTVHASGYRRHSFFWPIALIGVGVLLLLSNLGYFPATGWAVLWRFWPIALIALGVDVMIGRRTTGGAIASAVLILILVGLAIGAALFAEQIPVLVDLVKPAVLQYDSVEYPVNGIEVADISIDWTSAPGQLEALQDSGNLIEADIAYRGELVFDVSQANQRANVILDSFLQGVSYGVYDFSDTDAKWWVGIHPDVETELFFDVGSGACDFDLSELDVSSLEIDGGSGSITLTLPHSHARGTIDGGSGSLTIIVPKGVGLSLEIDRGSGSLHVDDGYTVKSGDIDDLAVWESIGFLDMDYQVNLVIDQGSGSIRIR